jgi:DNA modification methylase
MGDLSFPWKGSWKKIYIGGQGWSGKRDEGVLRGHIVVSWESGGRSHPTEKPVSLLRDIIKKLPTGALILDPFAGSGTTGVAAALEGRRCILIEKDPAYAELCRQRVKNVLSAGMFDLLDEGAAHASS